MGVDLGVGVFTDSTGVHEDHVGTFTVFGEYENVTLEQRSNKHRVIIMHLTNKHSDVNITRRRRLNAHVTRAVVSLRRTSPTANRSHAPVILTSRNRFAKSPS